MNSTIEEKKEVYQILVPNWIKGSSNRDSYKQGCLDYNNGIDTADVNAIKTSIKNVGYYLHHGDDLSGIKQIRNREQKCLVLTEFLNSNPKFAKLDEKVQSALLTDLQDVANYKSDRKYRYVKTKVGNMCGSKYEKLLSIYNEFLEVTGEPIGRNALAKKSDMSINTVSKFFKLLNASQ